MGGTGVTWAGTVADLVLTVIKVAGGVVGHSQALVADGLHSLSDLLTDAATLVTLRYASEPEDEGHPYGHGKIESVGAAIVGTMLVVIGFELVWSGGEKLYHFWRGDLGDIAPIAPWVLAIVVLSIAVKEALYHATVRIGRREQNTVLIANAWHHRSDAISSLLVLVGVGGALLWQLPWLDAVAALVVAAMVLKVAVQILVDALADLTDQALSEEERQRLLDHVSHVEGVVAFHEMRTRHFGGRALVDLHVQVTPYISVSEGHQIAERVRWALRRKEPRLIDVMVHIDAEDDQPVHEKSKDKMPSRAQLEEVLPGWIHQLHYLRGRVEVDLLLHDGERPDAATLSAIRERWPSVRFRETFVRHDD